MNFRSTQSLNVYTDVDDTVSFKTPSKIPRSVKDKAKSDAEFKGVDTAHDNQVLLSNVVTDLNCRNEKLVNELEKTKQELQKHQSNKETDAQLIKVQLDQQNAISVLEKSLAETQIQLSVKEKQLHKVQIQRDEAEKRLQTVNEEADTKSSRICSLNEELKLLTQDNLTLEEQVEKDKMTIECEKNELEEKCTFLHFTQEQLHTQIKTLQEHVLSLSSELENLKLQLENTSKELETEKLKLAEVTDTYVKENLDTENEFNRLTKESDKLHAQVTKLEAENKKIEFRNSELDESLKKAYAQIDAALRKDNELKSCIETLKSDLEVLKNDKEAVSEELQRVEEEKIGVALDLAYTSKEKIEIEETAAGLKTEKDAILNEIQALLSEKEELEKQMESTKEDLSKCQEQLSSLFESSEELQKIATQQKDHLDKKDKEVQDLRGEIQELDMKNLSLDGSLSSAQSEVANLEAENKTLLVSFESVEDSLRTYIHRCEDLNIEIQELTCCKDDLNQTCIILEKRMLDAEEIVEKDKAELEKLSNQIDSKDKDIKTYIAQTAELEAKVMDLQELVGLLEQRNQTAYEMHSEAMYHMQEEIKMSAVTKIDLETRVNTLQANLDTVTSERSQLVEMNEELSSEVSENLHTIKSLQEREQELNGRLELVCKELETAKSGMTSELQQHWEAEDEILQIQAEMEQTNVQLQEATNTISDLKSQVGGLKDRSAELENRYDALEANNIDTVKENDVLREELKTKSDEIKDLYKLKTQITLLESKLESSEEENSSTKVELTTQKELISSLNLSLEAQQLTVMEHKKKVAELEDDLKGTEVFLLRYQEMESLLKEYMNDVTALEEKDASNNQLIMNKDDLITQLRAELDPLQKETQSFKEKYEALCKLIEPFKDQLDSFETERAALLEKNKEAEGEVKKLATQYGQLLGHQNHKQKIQHLVKLKKENVDMREEMSRMRIELDKYRRLALKSETVFKYHNKENSLLQSSVVNMSTITAGRTPASVPFRPKTPSEDGKVKAMIFSSTPFRRQTIASPLSVRNRQHSPRT